MTDKESKNIWFVVRNVSEKQSWEDVAESSSKWLAKN